jgi:hypothetical protein
LVGFVPAGRSTRTATQCCWRGRCRLALFLCVYVFKSEIRFRVPFDVFFMPVALSGWTSIVFRLETGRKDETGNA